MSSRRARMERLLALRTRALETARLELAAAQRATTAAHDVHATAESAWTTRAAAAAATAFPTIEALADSAAHLDGLRRKVEIAARALTAARTAEDTARAACLRAERERRKIELLNERLAEIERQAEMRKERIVTDEVAARTFARTQAG